MQYKLTQEELSRFVSGIEVAGAIPFIDDIEDYILEAIWEYAKDIPGIDPFFNIRSKQLFDVVDIRTKVGWSVKSLQWSIYPGCEFELVIQRADVFKKAKELGFGSLSKDSDPDQIGAALLKHWNSKIFKDASDQGVDSKRVLILLKSNDRKNYALLEQDCVIHEPDTLYWKWSSSSKNGLKGYRKSDNVCVYRWYPSQKQFFERFVLPLDCQNFSINPTRLTKDQVVDILKPHLLKP